MVMTLHQKFMEERKMNSVLIAILIMVVLSLCKLNVIRFLLEPWLVGLSQAWV